MSFNSLTPPILTPPNGRKWGALASCIAAETQKESGDHEERRNSMTHSNPGSDGSNPSSFSPNQLLSPLNDCGIPTSFPFKPVKDNSRTLDSDLKQFSETHKSVATIFNGITQFSAVCDFFKQMPKGGDLHLHVTGSIFPHDIMKFAEDKGLFINPQTYLCFKKLQSEGLKVSELMRASTFLTQNQNNRESWKGVLSMEGRHIRELAGRERFFEACKYGESVLSHVPLFEQLAVVVREAKAEKTKYLEIMVEYVPERPKVSFEADFNLWLDKLANPENDDFIDVLGLLIKKQETVLSYIVEQLKLKVIEDLVEADKRVPELLSFKEKHAITSRESEVVVRYILEINRNQSPYDFFIDAFVAYSLAKADHKRILGINVVGPEDDMYSLNYYDTQLSILKYLSKTILIFDGEKEKHVNLTIHAGELDPEKVPISKVQDRIGKLVRCLSPGLKRIGHGFSLRQDSKDIYNILKEKEITIEACPSSSVHILGSLPPYFLGQNASKLGVTINTDDQGITLKQLSSQYALVWQHAWKGAEKSKERYSYRHFIRMNRSSLHASFLPGDSLYEKGIGGYLQIKKEYHSFFYENKSSSNEKNTSLESLSDKAYVQICFEKNLLTFEKEFLSNLKDQELSEDELDEKSKIMNIKVTEAILDVDLDEFFEDNLKN